MLRLWRRLPIGIPIAGCFVEAIFAQKAAQETMTWQQVREAFPGLNPDFAFSTDGTQISRHGEVWRPFARTQFSPSISYLHERQHQRAGSYLAAANQWNPVAGREVIQ